MRYTIVCVVNGYADTFSVQLDETETVHDLEIAIQAVHKGVDIDLHYPLLYLMNLNASNWVEEMKLRTQDLGQLVPLDRFEQLKDVFHSSSPHLRTVHILVQPSKVIKRLHSPTLFDREAKRSRKETSVDDAEISMIHSALESINPDVDFSNPKTYITLPFPSTLLVSRFDSLSAADTFQTFKYMGRSGFGDIEKEAENPHFLRGLYSLYLNGPSSIGKSYMLAALVCRLIRKGKYVLYIPDCSILLEHAEESLRCALQLAFHHDRVLCSQLSDAHLTDDLFRIVQEHAHDSLYVVLDQYNALDPDGTNGPLDQAKVNAKSYLNGLGIRQRCIFSRSGKHHSDHAGNGEQERIKFISLHAGLSEVETDCWFTHHAAELPKVLKTTGGSLNIDGK